MRSPGLEAKGNPRVILSPLAVRIGNRTGFLKRLSLYRYDVKYFPSKKTSTLGSESFLTMET